MRKSAVMLLVGAVLISGCATGGGVRNANREKTNHLSIGMTKADVTKLMGTETVTVNLSGVGYLWADSYEKISSPYRTETLQGKDKVFEVWYYYTDLKNTDGAITDDELMPVVFDDGKLIGWGCSFLEDNKNKYEIRVR